MKTTLMVIALCYACISTAFTQKNHVKINPLDTMILRVLNQWKIPGASVTIIDKNNVILAKGYGYKDKEAKMPMSENTLLPIGSCTKAFTIALFDKLVAEGKLDLDKSIGTYLPELKFKDQALSHQITIRDMITHRTGLPRHDFSWYSGAFTDTKSMVDGIANLEFTAPLRQNWQYNNFMYAALGMLLEKMYSKSWSTLIQEQIFKPLSMNSSNTEIDKYVKSDDFSHGYVRDSNDLKKIPFINQNAIHAAAPAGAINSSAKDMANWLLMWINGGKFDKKSIVSENFYRDAISSHMVVRAALPKKDDQDRHFFNYGLGWFVSSYRGHYGVGHGGNINGFTSLISFLPMDSIGVYITVNEDGSAVPSLLNDMILDKLIGAKFTDWSSISFAKNQTTPSPSYSDLSQKKNVKIESQSLDFYVGKYKHAAYGTIELVKKDTTLVGKFNKVNIHLTHKTQDHFVFSFSDHPLKAVSFPSTFFINPNSQVAKFDVVFEASLPAISFEKINEELKKVDLGLYAGNFKIGNMTLTIKEVDGKLQAQIPGQPTYQLNYSAQDEFQINGLSGYSLVFLREKEKVVAVNFVQPNGTFKAEKVE
jgi:CubicO group peptidase (beta-lactamase class C family)